MTKKPEGPVRVKLSEWRERKMAGAIEIEVDDGQVFVIPPPDLWPDEGHAARGDLPATAKAILGEDRYAAFLEAGGSARMLNAIFAEHHGADPGESSASPGS